MDKITVNLLFVTILAGICSGFECPQYSPPKKPCDRVWEGDCQKDSDCGHGHEYRCCIHPCYGGECYQLSIVWGCPTVRVNGICAAVFIQPGCYNDSDCSKNAKCCPQSCNGPDCVASPPKPGVCPNDINKRAVSCHQPLQCGVDADCPGNQKCCQTRCGGSECQDPAPEPIKVCFRNRGTGGDCVCKKKSECMNSLSWTICKKKNRKCKQKGYVCCCFHFDWSQKKCEKKKKSG